MACGTFHVLSLLPPLLIWVRKVAFPKPCGKLMYFWRGLELICDPSDALQLKVLNIALSQTAFSDQL